MQPFKRELKIKALSPTIEISINIDRINSKKYNISNYPYYLNHLIKD